MEITDDIQFEWIKEIPMYITLEPSTTYYFEPNLSGEEVKILSNRINPNLVKDDNIYDWLTKHQYGNEIKYFSVTEDMELNGWCDVSEIDEAITILYPTYNTINGREI